LVLVVITTIFAASLPGPEASAANGNSVTDTIQVRVVGKDPLVEITAPKDKSKIVKPDLYFHFDYYNAEYIDAAVEYTDANGNTKIIPLIVGEDRFVNYKEDDNYYEQTINLLGENYGYGEYKITEKATGFDGITNTQIVSFSFIPVYGEAYEDESDGLTYLDLHYDTDNKEIDTISVNIYNSNGDLVKVISPIKVKTPGIRVELPFIENGLPSDTYTIEIIALNKKGEMLYGKPYFTTVDYQTIPAPNTGSLFKGINISKMDYLITGLLIFASAVILGLVFVRNKNHCKNRLKMKKGRR
jgi:hypothetical protein